MIEFFEVFDVGQRKLLLLAAVGNFLQLEPGPFTLPVIRPLVVLLDRLVELGGRPRERLSARIRP